MISLMPCSISSDTTSFITYIKSSALIAISYTNKNSYNNLTLIFYIKNSY